MANPLDMVKEHPVATMVVVGGVGGAALIYYLLSRGTSASTGTATTTQTLTPAPTGSGGGSGSGMGNANNQLLQTILANQLSGVGSGINPSLSGISVPGMIPSSPPKRLCLACNGLAPSTSPPTVSPGAVKLNAAYQTFLANHIGGTSQQFAQDLNAAAGITPLTPAEALNLNYEHWLVSHPGGTSAQFSQQLRAAAAAKAA